MRLRLFAGTALCFWVAGSSLLLAQDGEGTERYPSEGIAILDCDPDTPAPSDSCTLRVPPGYRASDLQSDPTSDSDAEFRLARQNSRGFPEDLTLSATMLLVDLSPGPGSGRLSSFNVERTLISELVAGLPPTEEIAIYGFNEDFVQIQDFTTSRTSLQNAVDGLTLGGTNTLIGPFVRDAVEVLRDRDDVVFRNIILVSDGEDESGQSPEDAALYAVENDVIVSTLGTFWRPIGASETGAGITYMRTLAQGASGTTAQALLPTPSAAGDATGSFISEITAALRASGLILAVGSAGPAEISVTVSEPVPGQDALRDRDVSVSFTPSSATSDTAAEGAETDEAEAQLFGFPPVYVYSAAGVLVVLLALIGLMAMRRGRAAEDDLAEVVPADTGLDEDLDNVNEAPTKMHIEEKPVAVPSAFLVFENGHKRGAIVGQRVNVGRSKSNEIVIEAESISRLHAQIYKNREGGFSIADMDSLNGTFVNGKKINGTEPVALGDIITFGKEKAKLTPA